jgi:hypothetical protein
MQTMPRLDAYVYVLGFGEVPARIAWFRLAVAACLVVPAVVVSPLFVLACPPVLAIFFWVSLRRHPVDPTQVGARCDGAEQADDNVQPSSKAGHS